MPSLISPAERDYILKGIECNIRADGRQRPDYREVILETGVISQTSGSARVRLAGGTDVLVSVKADIGPVLVDPETGEGADKGQIICNVEWYINRFFLWFQRSSFLARFCCVCLEAVGQA